MNTPLKPQIWIQANHYNYCYELADKTIWLIGRKSDCDIILTDRRISRKHALLQKLDQSNFYFMDLGSSNGSFLNGQRVDTPMLLRHGNHISMGLTNLVFFNPLPICQEQSIQDDTILDLAGEMPKFYNSRSSLFKPDHFGKSNVLMIHFPKLQGEFWRQLLISQNVEVTSLPHGFDLHQYLIGETNFLKAPSNLLLIDIGSPKPNDYAFCRLCRQSYPTLKLILIASDRPEIDPGERHWAVRQGALDLLPGFPADLSAAASLTPLVKSVNCVLGALGQSFVKESFVHSLLSNFQLGAVPKTPQSC